jgi:hypothetical protein
MRHDGRLGRLTFNTFGVTDTKYGYYAKGVKYVNNVKNNMQNLCKRIDMQNKFQDYINLYAAYAYLMNDNHMQKIKIMKGKYE